MLRNSLPLGAALSLLGSTLVAQTQLFVDSGLNDIDKFGYSVRSLGDVDADGWPDFVYSSPFREENNIVNSGIVRVRSGRDFSLLYEFDGPRRQDEYGYQVNSVGDVNADGHDDILITLLIGTSTFQGGCEVLSGADGSVLYSVSGLGAYDYFGISGSGVGDVNADGWPDFAVGAPGYDVPSPGGLLSAVGQMRVFSGRDGSELFAVNGTNAGDEFGWFLDGAGDVNQDGYDDIVVGSPRHSRPGLPNSGRVQVISGSDQSVLFTFYGNTPAELFGWACSRAGDVNADGYPDIIAGGHLSDPGGRADAGVARVYSGFDGSVIHAWEGANAGDWFGYSVRDAGDVDGDGHADVAVGATRDSTAFHQAGMVRIYSGATGLALHTIYGATPGAEMGFSVASADDIDKDGYADLLVGAAFEDVNGQAAGRAYVYSFGGSGTPPIIFHRGAPCAGSTGNLPRVGVTGFPAIGNRMAVNLRGAQASAITVLNFGDAVNVPLTALGAPGCSGYADPAGFNISASTDALGQSNLAIDLPNLPGLVGLQFDFQWIVRDAGANSFGFTFSDAAIVKFGS